MNSKTIFSSPFVGYEGLSKMPHLVFRVLCAYLFDNSDFFGLSSDDCVHLLAAPNSGETGIRFVARVLRSLECSYFTVEKRSYPDLPSKPVDYFCTLNTRVSRFVII